MRHSHTVQRRRTIQRSLRRLKHRIKRLATSYVSPLGWAVAALAVASLVAFVLLGWHELLAMAVVFAVMLAAAVMLSLGNTSFQATIYVSSRRVTVSDTVKVDVCVDNPGRTPTTSARGDLPIGDNHERFAIPMLAAGQSRQTTVEFTAVSRAVLPIGPLSIRKGDPFGLIRHEKKLVDQINVFIHPQTVLLSTLNAGIPRDLEGQPSGEIVDDDLGHLFKSDQEQYGIKSILLKGKNPSGRAMVLITAPNAERTFADYMGAALELVPEDLKPEYFKGYDYFHIEGYLVQNQALIRKAVEMAKDAGCIISIDMASYNVVESNEAFLHDIVENYVDIVFANETEAKAFTKKEPREALDEIAAHGKTAIVKIGKNGSMVKKGNEYHYIEAWPADPIDATGAGDTYAAGFLYAHSLGMPLKVCGEIGSIIAAKVVEVIGTKIDIPRWKAAKKEIKALISETRSALKIQ